MNTNITREQWLDMCAKRLMAEVFAMIEVRAEMKLKISVGFPPNTRANTKKIKIGVCLPSRYSSMGFNEIYISPVCNDSMQVLETLVHELVHAIDDCRDGHQGRFAVIARRIGLVGPLTSTTAGPRLREALQALIDDYGDIPHAPVSLASRPKQPTRNIKVACSCGFKFNTSRSQIEKVVTLRGKVACPACGQAMAW